MGTRNLVCVVKDGQFRVAQYGQWDGYPSGQGQTIVDFLMNEYDPVKFRAQVDEVRHLTSKEAEARWNEASSKKSKEHLSRDTGAEILAYVQSAETPEVFMSLDFAADSLFCEWAYVVDLDRDALEVYKGFNTKPIPEGERFSDFECADNARRGTKYYPVRLFAEISFSALTKDSMEELETKANREYETESADA